jgi:hypothetical protein
MMKRRGYDILVAEADRKEDDFDTKSDNGDNGLRSFTALSAQQQVARGLRWVAKRRRDGERLVVWFVDKLDVETYRALLKAAPPAPRLLLVSWSLRPPPYVAGVMRAGEVGDRKIVEYHGVPELTSDLLTTADQPREVIYYGQDAEARERAVRQYGPVDKFSSQSVDRPMARYFGAEVGDLFAYRRRNDHQTGAPLVYRIVVPADVKPKAPSKAAMQMADGAAIDVVMPNRIVDPVASVHQAALEAAFAVAQPQPAADRGDEKWIPMDLV